jgi:hypothetical protein
VGKLTPTIARKFLVFDTAPLICYIEQHPQYGPVTEGLFTAVDRGGARAVTSVLTLLEVLIRPIRRGLPDLARQYRGLLSGARGNQPFPNWARDPRHRGAAGSQLRLDSNSGRYSSGAGT